jgi:hypothetical protein
MMSELRIEQRHIDELQRHPQNFREHPIEQVREIAASVERNGFYRPVVIARDSVILAGHGLVLAARLLGIDEVPVVALDLDYDDPRALKVLVGDNELSRTAIDDDEALVELLRTISEHDDLRGTGFDDDSMLLLIQQLDGESKPDAAPAKSEGYSRIVESPVYAVTGANPPVAALVDESKARELIERIDASGVPDNVKRFLRRAAARHFQFDYAAIAEFYAHADADVQDLMEQSALVIVDVDRAIELGFAKLATELRELADDASDDDD